MEKRLRSALQNSADEFLKSASKLGFKNAKPSLKNLIHSLKPSSPLTSSLPHSLTQSISQSITRFKQFSDSAAVDDIKSPTSPPNKRNRRSSRNSSSNDDSGTKDKCEDAKKYIIENLQICAHVAFLCVSHPKNVFTPSDLLPAARKLHDGLILFEFDSVLMMEISNLCEEWWKQDLPERETLISLFIPVLVSRSLTFQKKVDVNKIYALREAFTCFDFDDESIDDLKHLLLRCMVSPMYLKTEEGRKFLAFLFELNGQVVKDCLAMIKSQVICGRKSVLEAYGEIVFKAWRVINEESRKDIEDGFLQELMDSAIHASSDSFAAYIRKILGGFISQRTTSGVDKLLFHLAEPLIFRSLQVANSNVRQNALHLLLDLFPLADPDANKEGNDILLEKQFFLLGKLLTDECPAIRVVATEGSCRLLHMFWETITSSTIAKFLTKVFDDMTNDSCKEVRLSTVDGIMYLLGNPQSHEILKVLLPRAGHLVSDSSLAVRAAAVDLLLLISGIRNFQFHKVVQLDVLLSMLANDQPLVARKVTKLLMPSYFPSVVNPAEACDRCTTLVKRSPKAGARFCEFAFSEGASLPYLMELLKHIIGLALTPDQLAPDQIEALLDASAFICQDLASEASYKAVLKQEVSGGKLKSLFVASSRHACSAVCKIVSIVSPDGVDDFVEECMVLVTNCRGLIDNVEMEGQVRSVHKMMLACDHFGYMFETLARFLHNFATECHLKYGVERPKHDFPTTKRRKTKSSIEVSGKLKNTSHSCTSKFEEDYAIAAAISWQIKDLLMSEDTRKAILESGVTENAIDSLKVISEVSIVQTMDCDYVNVYPLLAYTTLALHISFKAVTFKGINNHGTKAKDSRRSYLEEASLEQTIDHLLSSANKLFGLGDSGKCREAPQEFTHAKSRVRRGKKQSESKIDVCSRSGNGSRLKRVSNMVKMLSAVLKFIVDVSSMELVSHSQPAFLNFTLEYLEFINSIVKQISQDKLQFKENDIKETFFCLKSSFTYASKLLNQILQGSCGTSSTLPETYTLSNKLLDLIISVEEHMGSSYAARIVAAAKPWLPDLILGLGSWNIQKQSSGRSICEFVPGHVKSSVPSWLKVLADIEVTQLDSDVVDDDSAKLEEYPAFRKLVGMLIHLSRSNDELLDAVGVIILIGTVFGLERNNFQLVVGLVQFICAKLVGRQGEDWEHLDMMLQYLKEIYPQIERETQLSNKLQSARELLEPIWMFLENGSGRTNLEEE